MSFPFAWTPGAHGGWILDGSDGIPDSSTDLERLWGRLDIILGKHGASKKFCPFRSLLDALGWHNLPALGKVSQEDFELISSMWCWTTERNGWMMLNGGQLVNWRIVYSTCNQQATWVIYSSETNRWCSASSQSGWWPETPLEKNRNSLPKVLQVQIILLIPKDLRPPDSKANITDWTVVYVFRLMNWHIDG